MKPFPLQLLAVIYSRLEAHREARGGLEAVCKSYSCSLLPLPGTCVTSVAICQTQHCMLEESSAPWW